MESPVHTGSAIHSNTASVKAAARIRELDGLRGIAIFLVVTCHYFYFGDLNYHGVGLLRNFFAHLTSLFAIGWSGVDLFFVLSGFLIGGILLEARGSPHLFRTFYLRRFYRIIPIYYVWILAYVLVTAAAGPFLRAHVQGGNLPEARYQILAQLLFLQNFGILGYAPIAYAWLALTWSLAVEEQFYLVAPIVIRYFSKRSLRKFLAAVILGAPPLRLFFYYRFPRLTTALPLAYTLTPCRADALAMGVFTALLWRDDPVRVWLKVHGRLLYSVAGTLALGMIALGKWFPSPFSFVQTSVGYTWNASFYSSVLLLAIAQPAGPIAWLLRVPWVRELGRVSYCVYLIHLAVSLVILALLRAAIGPLNGLEICVGNVLAAAFSYIIARMSWTHFEHPIVRIGHSFKY